MIILDVKSTLRLFFDAKSNTLITIIREKIQPYSIVYNDYWKDSNALDISDFKHFIINNSQLFDKKHNHINWIKDFWSQAKRHMGKFIGIPKQHLSLLLKECE